MSLKDKIVRLIRASGPISVAQYMHIALGDPNEGYYIARDPFGRDFITAPEISQIFGEMIGLFFVQAWEDRDRPAFRFVELGPGRGTLMADILRAAGKVRPEFLAKAKVSFVETSPLLRNVQQRTLEAHKAEWFLRFEDVPDDAPLFLVANEFFDALPIRQFVKGKTGWHERTVTAADEDLRFALSPDAVPDLLIPETARTAKEGSLFETCPAATALMQEIAARIGENGVALLIDYGHAASGLGDTLQAVKANAFADILDAPGDADITAHVDFGALAKVARENGHEVFGPRTQGAFLDGLGIGIRAAILKKKAPDHAVGIEAALERLTSPAQMGTLFKVLGVSDGKGLPGFVY